MKPSIGLMIRAQFTEGDNIRDAGLTTPKEIERFDNIVYGTDEKWQSLDVYRPKEIQGNLPVIISVHGGGWVYGDKERYSYYCMDLAKRGFAVVNYTYRLAPEFQYPAPLEDTNLVMCWVLEHAEEYGFDANNLFALGDSAGGHLLGLYLGIMSNEEYAANYNFAVPEKLSFNAVALNCGQYVVSRENADEMILGLMSEFLPQGGTEEEFKLVTVTNHIKQLPPVYLMTAYEDFLRNQAPYMESLLKELAVPYVFKCYGDEKNPLQHVFHLNIRSQDAIECNDEECQFFKKNMK